MSFVDLFNVHVLQKYIDEVDWFILDIHTH